MPIKNLAWNRCAQICGIFEVLHLDRFINTYVSIRLFGVFPQQLHVSIENVR